MTHVTLLVFDMLHAILRSSHLAFIHILLLFTLFILYGFLVLLITEGETLIKLCVKIVTSDSFITLRRSLPFVSHQQHICPSITNT